MPLINMGTLNVVNHNAESISEALGVPSNRFDEIFQEVQRIWSATRTVSETIEKVCTMFKNSECALALVITGIILESRRPKK